MSARAKSEKPQYCSGKPRSVPSAGPSETRRRRRLGLLRERVQTFGRARTDDGGLTHTRNLFLGRSAFRYGGRHDNNMQKRVASPRGRTAGESAAADGCEIPATDSAVGGVPRKRELWPHQGSQVNAAGLHKRWYREQFRSRGGELFRERPPCLLHVYRCTCPIEGNAWRHLRQNICHYKRSPSCVPRWRVPICAPISSRIIAFDYSFSNILKL